MVTHIVESPDIDSVGLRRRLLLVWQHPDTRRFAEVGELDHLVDGRYVFKYLDAARDEDAFAALDEYPRLDEVYVSDSLPVFFSNRVMSSERASYDAYLRWMGLDGASWSDELPIEILTRSGGGRATDTFHILEAPLVDGDHFESRFFVSGVRHVSGASARIAALKAGDELAMRAEPGNPTNRNAVLIEVSSGEAIGWVPDWLCGRVAGLLREGALMRARVERVNEDAPSHVKVLCNISTARSAA